MGPDRQTEGDWVPSAGLRGVKARKGDGGIWVLEAQQAARILTFLSMMGVNSPLHLTLLGLKRVRHCQTVGCKGLLA